MEKLELKHLAPYLPYDLKIDVCGRHTERVDSKYDLTAILDHSGYKPILHPLSDLTKPIKVEGYNNREEFRPVEEFLQEYGGGVTVNSIPIWESDFITNIIYSDINTLPYGVVKKLFQWHFDIEGLIESGLAIDINTLNK